MRTEDQVATMSCPVCGVSLSMSDRQGIEIDYCPQCRGVWLDRGELDKIIERSGPATVPAREVPAQNAYPGQAPQYGHKAQYGYKKKQKSWLHDIFD